ncbi:hypothetical protein OESDEN_06014 [Oesophagostomum dentatum]|uniref:Uncharacterized protein n=1 Tax=Oesophagostomum dentatum TaxID=61180 RepID=A0A0B1TF96_OESDE|nr:hypothetical protein OESDEN_06014 [Oesophagostomum dentatum]
MKIVVKTLTGGEAKDVRSDSEYSDEEEKENLVKQNGKKVLTKKKQSKNSTFEDSDDDAKPVQNGVKYRRPRKQ